MKKLPVLFPTRSENPVHVPVGTPDASMSGMSKSKIAVNSELNITNSVVQLWHCYRALLDDEKEVVARGIVARLFGECELFPSMVNSSRFVAIVESELNAAQSRGGVLAELAKGGSK